MHATIHLVNGPVYPELGVEYSAHAKGKTWIEITQRPQDGSHGILNTFTIHGVTPEDLVELGLAIERCGRNFALQLARALPDDREVAVACQIDEHQSCHASDCTCPCHSPASGCELAQAADETGLIPF